MKETITKQMLVHLFGEISDHTVVRLLDLDITLNELENVALRLSQENDVDDVLSTPLTVAAKQAFDLLSEDDLYSESDENR